ncbi:homeobox protein Hox-A1 isoform X2 [Podarcis muralis]
MDTARMNSFLDYPPILNGESATCSPRAYHHRHHHHHHPDHGITTTTFQSCAVSANNCNGDDRFLVGRGVQISPHPHHQTATYQHHPNLGMSYAHPSCGPTYGVQNFGAGGYSHYPLAQEAEINGGFPQCAPALYSGNVSSSVVQQPQVYAGGPVGSAQYIHPSYGEEQQSLTLTNYSHPLSPLHSNHQEGCASPSSETSPPAQTFDWMKVKRNPPKTALQPEHRGSPSTSARLRSCVSFFGDLKETKQNKTKHPPGCKICRRLLQALSPGCENNSGGCWI